MGEPRTCELRAKLFRFGPLNTEYDANAGLRRSMALWGRINERDERFDGKGIRISIYAPRKLEWEDQLKQAEEIESACGVVRINANVRPKRFDFDGEYVEEEPVQVQLFANNNAFDALRQVTCVADEHLRVLYATIQLSGKSVPDKDRRLCFQSIRDFDISEDKAYAVSSFELCETRSLALWRRRVLPLGGPQDDPHGGVFSVLLTEARYNVTMDRGDVHSICCEGRLVSRGGNDCSDVTIEFEEYKRNRVTDELPERSFTGEFGYWPKQDGELAGHFWFRLRYVPTDAREILLPLLTQETGTELILLVGLTNKTEEFSSAQQEVRGHVRWFGFQVRKRLLDETK